VVLWDKLGFEPPRIWRTPDVIMGPLDHRAIAALEDAHLRRTGAPKEAIRAEIAARQERVRALFAPSDRPPRRTTERMAMGGAL